MKRKESLNKLVQKIPTSGLSKKNLEVLPDIIEQYLNGNSRAQTTENLEKSKSKKIRQKCSGYVGEIYKRIEYIKLNGLKKMYRFTLIHPNSIQNETQLANAIIEYSIKVKNLEEKLINNFENPNKIRRFIKRKYKEGKHEKDDIKILDSLGKHPALYLLLLDEILSKMNN